MKLKILFLALIIVACKKDKDEKTVVKKTSQVGGYNNGYPGYPNPGGYPGYPNPSAVDYTLYCLRISSEQNVTSMNNAGSVYLNNVPMIASVIPCTSFSTPNSNLYIGTGYLGDVAQLSLNLTGSYNPGSNINLSISGNLDMRPTMYYNSGRTTNASSLCRYGNNYNNMTYGSSSSRPIIRVYLNGRLNTGMSIYHNSQNSFVGTAIACDDAGGSAQIDLSGGNQGGIYY